ncbi:protein Mpv17 [Biomphalaria pfeifferi]|uniref:Mitochondrial inner membrane protein Mpv17 n=1 Tax=Biomphalaria pfeifferi TaxID=112525 RepID=A0AAD8C419_BIOPF|nr:protein Mpv17 [Biomphalaria pfeifferi]
MVTRLWQGYSRLLKTYPLRTMAFTTGTIMTAGDCISQLAIERKGLQQYDLKRSSRFLVLGFCFFGPMMRGWYLTLDKLYAGKKFAAIKMMATDQLCMSPFFLSTFLTVMGLLKGETIQEIKNKFQKEFFPLLFTSYKVWPLAQLINFYVLPLQHRVLFVNCVALGWNTYLAWVTERKQ